MFSSIQQLKVEDGVLRSAGLSRCCQEKEPL